MFRITFSSKVVEYMRGLTSVREPPLAGKGKPLRRDPDIDSLDCEQVIKDTRTHKTKSKKEPSAVTKLYRKAVLLHRKTLEVIFKGPRWAARDAGIVEIVKSILNAIVSIKAKLGMTVKTLTKKVKEKVKKPKSTRRGAVMYLNPRHHKTKVHITTEQRAINKEKDGKLNREEIKDNLFQVSVKLVSDGVNKVLGYKANPTPTPRKVRNKFAQELKVFFKKVKYSPYSGGHLSQAA